MLVSNWTRRFLVVASLSLGMLLLLLTQAFSRVSTQASPKLINQANNLGQYSSAMLAITPDGQRLVVVNPDSNSVSIVDTASYLLQAEVIIGVDPRAVAISPAGHQAFVVNQGSDDIVSLEVGTGAILRRVVIGDRPAGVAISPDGRFLAVAELGDDRIRFLDTVSLTTLSIVPVADRPHGLAFTPDGRQLAVTHLLNGAVTLIDVLPYASYLPLMGFTLRSSMRLEVEDPNTSEFVDPAELANRVQISTWPNVAPAPSVAINHSGTRAYLPQTMANGQGLNTQFDTTVFPKVSVIDLENNLHLTSEHISLPEADQPVGLPWHVALAPDETELWVVNAASNDISVIDISNPTFPQRITHLVVGDNPRGLVFNLDGTTAFVNNTLAGTVSVIDTATYSITQIITVTDIPLPAVLLQGKRLFHSSERPDLAQARWISCNTCHVEGGHDGRTWLIQYLGTVPPGSTPVITRNTTSLLGMIETYPLRWSAEWDESADSEFSVRFEQFGTGLIHNGDINPTLGPPNQGRSADLDALAAFIDSLEAPASTRNLSPAAERGRIIFESATTGCSSCHPAPLYTNLQQYDVGTADAPGEFFGPEIDTPTLRFLYDSAPYLHDGSAASLIELLTLSNPDDQHGGTSHLSLAELNDLVAYILSLPFD